MEFLIFILIVGGFWFIGWVFSSISNMVDEKQAKIRTRVAEEVLEGREIEKVITKYQERLNYISYKRENVFNQHILREMDTVVTEILGNCPECKNGFLQLRKGPYGKFLGCSNYPNCRHTEVDRSMKKYKEKAGEQFWNDIKEAYSI